MRWAVRKQTPEQREEERWFPHLAIVPVKIGDEWVWLEFVEAKFNFDGVGPIVEFRNMKR